MGSRFSSFSLMPALAHHILSIGLMGTQEQMGWIDTDGIVTVMAYQEPLGYRSMV